MKLTVLERKYVTGYFITIKTVFTTEIDLSINFFCLGLAKIKPVYDRKLHI